MSNGFAIGSLTSPAEGAVLMELTLVQNDSRTIHLKDPVTHVSVSVGSGVSASVVLWIDGASDTVKHACEVFVGDEASCTVLCINAAAQHASVSIAQRSQVGAGGKVQWQNVTLGGASTEHDLVSHVVGHDGESAVDWMFYAKGEESQKLNVRNIFDAENGRGEILMRGIAEEKGHTVCRGLIDIGLKGGGTNTYLTQEVLMLDASAKVDAIPSLEIKTNDVKASHSATVARVTEEDLFYFGARGIDPTAAREMFVLGFLGDITKRIGEEEASRAVIAAVEAKYRS